MKQHITKEQWSEITEEQQELFVNDIEPEEVAYIGDVEHCNECGNNCLPSIGQMIEFLVEHGYQTNDYYIDDSFSSVITFVHRMESKETIEIGWTNYCGKSKELCDALWEAVKEVLQDEKKNKETV